MTDAVQTEPNAEPFRPIRETLSPAAQKLDDHLAQSIADFREKPTMTASPTGFVPGEISSLFKTLRARKDAMVTDLMATGAEVAATIATGEAMTAALKAEGDAMKAEFGQLTNQ